MTLLQDRQVRKALKDPQVRRALKGQQVRRALKGQQVHKALRDPQVPTEIPGIRGRQAPPVQRDLIMASRE
ncbi:hypothetical protein PA598K_01683 [Paenibacillus sp. 598K]|nr:hypothetical protein PA598K_01683 [Paenibacillus sp. 598K]